MNVNSHVSTKIRETRREGKVSVFKILLYIALLIKYFSFCCDN